MPFRRVCFAAALTLLAACSAPQPFRVSTAPPPAPIAPAATQPPLLVVPREPAAPVPLVATAAAERITPPEPTGLNGLPLAPPGLSNCDDMTFYREQAGLPARFDGIGWRESNCRNEESVHTSCCYGYWQLHRAHFPAAIFEPCDVDSYLDVDSDTPLDKQRQACAAKALFDRDGWSPWKATT